MTNLELVISLREAEIIQRRNNNFDYANLIRELADAFEKTSTPLACEITCKGYHKNHRVMISTIENSVIALGKQMHVPRIVPAKEPTHIDDFIDDYKQDAYARWMFMHFRLPAHMKMAFDKFIENRKLFCIWKEKCYRVTGASRLGDVWLTSNFKKDHGYEYRVCVDECSEWSEYEIENYTP